MVVWKPSFLFCNSDKTNQRVGYCLFSFFFFVLFIQCFTSHNVSPFLSCPRFSNMYKAMIMNGEESLLYDISLSGGAGQSHCYITRSLIFLKMYKLRTPISFWKLTKAYTHYHMNLLFTYSTLKAQYVAHVLHVV